MAGITDISKLFGGTQPDSPNDPGVYGPEYQYQPDRRSENPYVPQNWGDIAGQLLGNLGNIRRAQRNAQAQALLNSWNIAQANGPQAAQDFLNNPNLPSWFKDKVLAGITPQMFDPALQRQAQQIYSEVQTAVKSIYAQAAAIQDPSARDQFIDRSLATLRQKYPGSDLINLPRNPDGHYAVPGMESDQLLDQVVMLPNGKPMMNPATGKPYRYRDLPLQLRAQLEAKSLAGQMSRQMTGGQTLRQAAPQLVAVLKGTSYEALLDQPADAFLDQNGQIDVTKLQQLIYAARQEQTQTAGTVWLDPATDKPVPAGTPGAMAVPAQDYLYSKFGRGTGADKTNSEARLRFNAKVNAMKGRIGLVQARIKEIQDTMTRNNGADWIILQRNNPQLAQSLVQELRTLQSQLDDSKKGMYAQLDQLLQQDPDLGTNPATPGGAGGAGGKSGEWWYQNNKMALVNAIYVAEGSGKGLDPQYRGKLDNKLWISQNVDAIYKQWVQAGKPGDFISFLGKTWAPVGAANDPKGLNRNWIGNVETYLGTQVAPAAGPRVYTDVAYQNAEKAAQTAIAKGLSYPAFEHAVLQINPGMDKTRLKQVWDKVVAARKAQRRPTTPARTTPAYTGFPNELPIGPGF